MWGTTLSLANYKINLWGERNKNIDICHSLSKISERDLPNSSQKRLKSKNHFQTQDEMMTL